MNKTAVLIGGTFNPFTNAHKQMAVVAGERYPEADIIFVPSNLDYINCWKELPDGDVFSGKGRVELIEQSVKDLSFCSVSDVECSGRIDGRTYHTVLYFKERYEKVVFCIGSDKLQEMERWYCAEELLQAAGVLLFTRGEALADLCSEFIERHREKFTEIAFSYPEVSSSLVRELYQEGKLNEIKKYVPEPVYRYLCKRRENI